MAVTAHKKMIFVAAPVAWVWQYDMDGTLSELWRFDNLAPGGNVKTILPSSDASGAEKVEIVRADNAKFKFDAYNLVLNGVTENDETPATSSTDATNHGDITLVTNEAPIELNSMSAFLRKLSAPDPEAADYIYNKRLIVIVPVGFSYKSLTDPTLLKPDGFAFMSAKYNSAMDLGIQNSAATQSMNFLSYKNPDSEVSAAELAAISPTPIAWKKGAGNDPTITPPTLTTADAQLVLDGKCVIVPNITY